MPHNHTSIMFYGTHFGVCRILLYCSLECSSVRKLSLIGITDPNTLMLSDIVLPIVNISDTVCQGTGIRGNYVGKFETSLLNLEIKSFEIIKSWTVVEKVFNFKVGIVSAYSLTALDAFIFTSTMLGRCKPRVCVWTQFSTGHDMIQNRNMTNHHAIYIYRYNVLLMLFCKLFIVFWEPLIKNLYK